MKQILACDHFPTAVMASNDLIALDALEIAGEQGVMVPDDISIIGFDDIDAAATSTPPLTTIKVFRQELAEKALAKLLREITDNERPRLEWVDVNLIERHSCQRRRREIAETECD